MTFESGRIIVISDIHGEYNKFMELLEKVGFNGEHDKLVLLGDYIDRGAKSYEVIKKVRELQELYGKNVIALKGNHELMMQEALSGEEYENQNWYEHYLWSANGGTYTKLSYINKGKQITEDLSWIMSLPTHFETENYYFVHAGINPNVAIDKQVVYDKVWIREEFLYSDFNIGKKVIFGHTFLGLTPFFDDNKIGIDTGLVYGGALTALIIHDGEITGYVQVDKSEIKKKTKQESDKNEKSQSKKLENNSDKFSRKKSKKSKNKFGRFFQRNAKRNAGRCLTY